MSTGIVTLTCEQREQLARIVAAEEPVEVSRPNEVDAFWITRKGTYDSLLVRFADTDEENLMASRRDSRTDGQRKADFAREDAWHRERSVAGLPPVHYALVINVTIRDVTDEEAEHLRRAIGDAAAVVAEECPTDRDSRAPSWAGSSSTVERSIFAEENR